MRHSVGALLGGERQFEPGSFARRLHQPISCPNRTTELPMVLCVAVFNKEDCLLFSRTKDSERERGLELEAFIYCSYDIIGEKVRLAMDKTAQECYLGSLLLNNTYRSYGYLTNTNVKFLLVVDAANHLLKDQDIRAIFKRLHADYCKSISNPFYQLNTPLRSRYLADTCDEIFET